MAKSGISLRIEDNNLKELDKLAKVLKRDRSYLINEAIADYVDFHKWQLEQIEIGVQQADKGAFATDKEVQRILNKWRK